MEQKSQNLIPNLLIGLVGVSFGFRNTWVGSIWISQTRRIQTRFWSAQQAQSSLFWFWFCLWCSDNKLDNRNLMSTRINQKNQSTHLEIFNLGHYILVRFIHFALYIGHRHSTPSWLHQKNFITAWCGVSPLLANGMATCKGWLDVRSIFYLYGRSYFLLQAMTALFLNGLDSGYVLIGALLAPYLRWKFGKNLPFLTS